MNRHLNKFHAIILCFYDKRRKDLILPFIAESKKFIIQRVHEFTRLNEQYIKSNIFEIHPLQIKYHYVASGSKSNPYIKEMRKIVTNCPEKSIINKRAIDHPDEYDDDTINR